MTFPAEISARRDPRLSLAARAVYGYLTTELDIHDVRGVSTALHADRAGVSRETFAKARDDLLRFGYLVDHGRGLRNVRRLTLAYSIAEKAAS